MGVRRQAREAAIQAIYMCDSLDEWDLARATFCLSNFDTPSAAVPYATQLLEGVLGCLPQIDSQIATASEHWSLNRMSRVDRSILRLASYEVLFLEDIPLNVAIDEAIEISKRFGSDNSSIFVNGVLDKVASSLRNKIEVSATPASESRQIDADLPVSATQDDANDEFSA